MKRFLVAAALLATTAAAQSADLGRQAPVFKAPIMQVYNWTGFYIGVNAGIGVGQNRTQLVIPAAPSAETSHLSPFGAIGGGQIGYNWQINQNWLVGVEADIQASGQRDSYTCLLTCTPAFRTNLSQELDWFGTVRGRVGIVKGPVVSYFTGGLAYGHTNTSLSETNFFTPGSFSVSNTKVGYAIGSGVEASLGGNWTGKLEYLYVDLGKQTHNFVLLGAPHALTTRFRNNIFRAGLNYRIGANAGYNPPPSNWTGFYLGGNGGSLLGRNRSTLSGGAGLNENFHLVPDGYAGGVQAGYNWQAAAWVFGIEADFQGAYSRDEDTCIALCAAGTGAFVKQSLPWFGTVRGRVGYTVGATLLYATGGFAYGQTETKITEFAAGVGIADVTIKRNQGGYAVGAGIETPFELFGLLGPNWTTKSEYLFVDLGRTTDSFMPIANPTQTFSTRTQEHIFRTGINYQFNAPVVAKY